MRTGNWCLSPNSLAQRPGLSLNKSSIQTLSNIQGMVVSRNEGINQTGELNQEIESKHALPGDRRMRTKTFRKLNLEI